MYQPSDKQPWIHTPQWHSAARMQVSRVFNNEASYGRAPFAILSDFEIPIES